MGKGPGKSSADSILKRQAKTSTELPQQVELESTLSEGQAGFQVFFPVILIAKTFVTQIVTVPVWTEKVSPRTSLQVQRIIKTLLKNPTILECY